MADGRSITLTDVMKGVHKLDLVNILSEECFTFLIGLILEANELGFKNPFNLTVKQAMGAGGGNSRQQVNRRRNTLSQVRIDGKPILRVTPGSAGAHVAAVYDINYNLLMSYNQVWKDVNTDRINDQPKTPKNGDLQNVGMTEQNNHASQKCDGRDTEEIPSLDQRREDKKDNNNITSISSRAENGTENVVVEEFLNSLSEEEQADVRSIFDTVVANEADKKLIVEWIQKYQLRYVLEKAALTRENAKTNAMGYFRRAIEGGWTAPEPPPEEKAYIPPPVELTPEEKEEREEQERELKEQAKLKELDDFLNYYELCRSGSRQFKAPDVVILSNMRSYLELYDKYGAEVEEHTGIPRSELKAFIADLKAEVGPGEPPAGEG